MIRRYHNKFPICKFATACLWQIRDVRHDLINISKRCLPVLFCHEKASPVGDRKYPRCRQKSKRSSADAPEDHPEVCLKARPGTTLEITREVSLDCRCYGAHWAELRQIADMAARLARAARTLRALPRLAHTLPIRHGCCRRLGLAAMLSVDRWKKSRRRSSPDYQPERPVARA